MINILKDGIYYRSLFFLEEEELKVFQDIGNVLEEEKALLFQTFYEWLDTHPLFQQYYTVEVVMAIKDSEDVLWEDLVQPKVSDEYIERQTFFGEMFASVGIPFEAYLAFLNYYHELFRQLYYKKGLASVKLLDVFYKVTSISISIVTDGYNIAMNKVLLEQNEVLREMSTPVTELWDGILFLPLVGIIDSKRASDVMETMLGFIAEKQSKVFILDISGIAIMDTAVANYIMKISKATKLMGCQCIICGISAAVAQTIVELGINVEEINSTGNMLGALKLGLKLTDNKM